MNNTKAASAFSLGLPLALAWLAKRALGLNQVEAVYQRVRAQQPPAQDPADFCRRVLADLGVPYGWDAAQATALAQLPGPVIVAANHPMGALDALALMALMGQARPGARFMVNAAIDVMPELSPGLLGVHIMERA